MIQRFMHEPCTMNYEPSSNKHQATSDQASIIISLRAKYKTTNPRLPPPFEECDGGCEINTRIHPRGCQMPQHKGTRHIPENRLSVYELYAGTYSLFFCCLPTIACPSKMAGQNAAGAGKAPMLVTGWCAHNRQLLKN